MKSMTPQVIHRDTRSTVAYPPHIQKWVEESRRKGYSVSSYNVTPLPGQSGQFAPECRIDVVMTRN